MIEPSDFSYGRLGEIELPPHKLFPQVLKPLDGTLHDHPATSWCEPVSDTGEVLTNGDLNGVLREDYLVGYVPLENAQSKNGWWKSNNLGARASVPTTSQKKVNTNRILIFGESFISGSRVRQDQTVQHFMNKNTPALEVINFAVDGYSMGQSFLRFKTLKDKLDFDLAALVVVPTADLWREVNVNRRIGESWNSDLILPRFSIYRDKLRLVPSPYKSFQAMITDNKNDISQTLRDHLVTHDAFYIKSLYEPTPILSSSVMFRLFNKYRGESKRESIRKNVRLPGSEAMKIMIETARAMSKMAESEGSSFDLIILPTLGDLRQALKSPVKQKIWEEMSSNLCSADYQCYDLMADLQSVPFEKFDRVCDKWHFGARTNEIIAKFLTEQLRIQ